MVNKQVLAFQSSLKKEGVSPATITTYINSIDYLYKWLGGKQLTADRLEEFKNHLMITNAASTVQVRIVAINRYLKFIKSDKQLKNIKLPKPHFKDNIISDKEYKKLCDVCLTNEKLRQGRMYYCIIRVLATTGIRISELLKLEIKDYKKGYADIISKANHARRVYIPKKTCEEVLAYAEQRGIDSGFPFPPLSPGYKLNPRTLNRRISEQLKKLAALAKIDPENVYPHSFRHFFAKQFLKKNKDIVELADILGHTSIDTTKIYLQKTQAEQERSFRKVVDW